MHLVLTHVDAEIVEVMLAGDLDAHTTPDLELVAQSLDPDVRILVLDMHCADFIDGAALRCLERIVSRARDDGVEVTIEGATRTLIRVLDICNSPLRALMAP